MGLATMLYAGWEQTDEDYRERYGMSWLEDDDPEEDLEEEEE